MNTPSIVEDVYSGAGDRRLFLRHTVPEKPVALVTLVHGYGEHGGRYLETMERLAAHGFAVYCPDIRGFGGSEETPGDLESVALIAEDLRILTANARTVHPGLPSILIGHSMGGMLALNQLLVHQNDYDLAVASGPAVLPPPDAGALMIAMVGLIARIAPRMGVQNLDLTQATRDEQMIARDDADATLYRGKVLARTGFETLRTQKLILASLDKITLPLLLLHGEKDAIISPRATDLVFEGIRSTVKEKIVFPGLFHEVLNEPERDEVFSRMFTWIDSVMASRVY